MHKSTTLQKVKRVLSIPTSSAAYQTWKLCIILLSFFTSFHYAYYAAFLNRASPSEAASFLTLDSYYMAIFCVDMVIHLFVDEMEDDSI